jgi:hypothetical protein
MGDVARDSSTDDEQDRRLLLDQVRHAFGRAAYTHKTHEKQADWCYSRHQRQQWFLTGLTAVSSGAFLTSLSGLFMPTELGAVATSFFAVLVTGITLATKNFKHGEDMQKHRDVAAKVWNLRESDTSLLVDLESGACSTGEARIRRDQLQGRAFEIYSDAPRTTKSAYATAQVALQNKGDLSFTEKEIDALLPRTLRQDMGGDNED